MTVMSAPRMTPLIVSSLMFSRARDSSRAPSLLAILFSQIDAGAWRGRRGMPPDSLPPAVVVHPHVGQHDAILDDPAEIFEAPARLDGTDHHVPHPGRVEDLDFDRLD